MTLEVQICTFGIDGLERTALMQLPSLKDVFYTVIFQNSDFQQYTLPPALQRSDIKVLEHHSIGLSNNRNFALSKARGDIILVADDDLNYTPEGLESVLDVFREHQDIDFATFCHHGGDKKAFPSSQFDFAGKEPKGYYVTSFEIALRKESIPAHIRFSPNLGIGAPLFGAAEESVFIHRLKNSGLKGRFFPIDIVEHYGVTTGNRPATMASLRAQGAWIWIRYGRIEGFMRLFIEAHRRNAPYLSALKGLSAGFFTAHRFFNSDGSDKL